MNRFLKTFGAIIVRGALKLPEEIEAIYDDACLHISGKSVKEERKKIAPVIGGVEGYEPLATALIKAGLLEVISSVWNSKENLYYFGSDLSSFDGPSNWHRDSCNNIPLWKIGIYLEGSYGDEQQFMYLPGTHHVDDSYSKALGEACLWPNGSGLRASCFRGVVTANENESQIVLPAVGLKIERGDVIVFDTRLLHAVDSRRLRRLIAIGLVPSVKTAAEYTGGAYLQERDYLEALIKMRCASKIVEMQLGRKVFYGQKQFLKCPDLISEMMPFRALDEDDIDYYCEQYFPGRDLKLAMENIHKYHM